jgi:hypothetical protein
MAIVLDGSSGITNDSGYTGDGVSFADSTPANTLVTTSGGNVGMGTSSPAAPLHVAGTIVDNPAAVGFLAGQINNFGNAKLVGSAGGYIDFTDTSAGQKGRILYTNSDNAMSFRTNGANERMRIDSAGNVGIGTSSPTYKFQVTTAGADNLVMFQDSTTWTANGGSVLASYYNNTTLISGIKFSSASTTSGYLSFHTGGITERARIDTSGNLLVGTTSTSPNSLVNIRGGCTLSVESESWYHTNVTNAASGLKRWRFGSIVNGDFAFETVNDAYSSATRRFTVTGTGNVLAPGVYNLTTGAGANVHVGADGTMYRSTSSLKYKTDVQDATHGLGQVMALRPVTYKGVNDGETVFGGLIAEEVHEAGLTEFVQYAEDGTPDALAYANMVSLAFKAIQEQQAIITALTARVEALEGAQA